MSVTEHPGQVFTGESTARNSESRRRDRAPTLTTGFHRPPGTVTKNPSAGIRSKRNVCNPK